MITKRQYQDFRFESRKVSLGERNKFIDLSGKTLLYPLINKLARF
jgi:hypothetical protein